MKKKTLLLALLCLHSSVEPVSMQGVFGSVVVLIAFGIVGWNQNRLDDNQVTSSKNQEILNNGLLFMTEKQAVSLEYQKRLEKKQNKLYAIYKSLKEDKKTDQQKIVPSDWFNKPYALCAALFGTSQFLENNKVVFNVISYMTLAGFVALAVFYAYKKIKFARLINQVLKENLLFPDAEENCASDEFERKGEVT